MNKAHGGKVAREYLFPKPIAFFVALAFGRHIPALERRTLIKGGRPLATGYRAFRLSG